MVYSVLHFLTHPHLNPGACASFLSEQPWPAASAGIEDVTHSKQNVALSWRLRVSSWVCDISEGGKNSVPNLISGLESGSSNPFSQRHRNGEKKINEEYHGKGGCLLLLWPSALKGRYTAHGYSVSQLMLV